MEWQRQSASDVPMFSTFFLPTCTRISKTARRRADPTGGRSASCLFPSQAPPPPPVSCPRPRGATQTAAPATCTRLYRWSRTASRLRRVADLPTSCWPGSPSSTAGEKEELRLARAHACVRVSEWGYVDRWDRISEPASRPPDQPDRHAYLARR